MQARVHFDGIAALIGTALLMFSGVAQAQDVPKEDQKCVNSINKGAAKVAKVQAKENATCVKNEGKGRLTTSVEECLTADERQKVAATIGKIRTGECLGAPSVLPGLQTDSADIGDTMVQKDLDLIHALFGNDLDSGVIVSFLDDEDGAKCQAAIIKAAGKCQVAKLDSYIRCKKSALKGRGEPITSPDDLETQCMTPTIPDVKGKIDKHCINSNNSAKGGLATTLKKKCKPNKVDADALIPGCGTNDPEILAVCIDQKIECVVCLALNAIDGLNRDCDDFDDGTANGSCLRVSSVLPVLDPNDVIFLASDALEGRDNNTAGSFAAQEYLIDELELIAIGLDSSQTGRAAFKQAIPLGTNILALIPGGELPDEYVMVGAHYDFLGTSCTILDLDPNDTICNGATDNATGVAAVLAIGRAVAGLPNPPRRSLILALWDREEDGLLGSAHYVQNPLVPLASTIAYVNFDIQGANLLPSLRDFSIAVGAETGGANLRGLLDNAISGSGLGTRAVSAVFGQGRSDYINFIGAAGVPTVFFTDINSGCYHTNEDEVAIVDFGKLAKQSQIALNLTLSLVDVITPPPFVTPFSPLATFEDAVVINDAVNIGISDLVLGTPSQQAIALQIMSDLNAIVADGEANFDSADIATLVSAALSLVSLLASGECDGFLSP